MNLQPQYDFMLSHFSAYIFFTFVLVAQIQEWNITWVSRYFSMPNIFFFSYFHTTYFVPGMSDIANEKGGKWVN